MASISLLFRGISSPIWGVISDRYGRNLTIRTGLGLFIIFSIVCGCAPNITVLLIFRALQSIAASVTMVVGQSVIADIYPPDKRGWATGIFLVPALFGVVLGPITGGVLSYFCGWRSTFVFLAILSTFILVVYMLIIPETHQYKVLVKHLEKKIIESKDISEPKLNKPWLPLIYLTDLTILPYMVCTTVLLACMIINETLLAILLAKRPYFFNELKIGISLIPTSVATVIGSLLGGALYDKANHYYTNNVPEGRLVPGIISLVLIPFGLVIFGWGLYFRLSVIVPVLGSTLVAFGQTVFRPAVYSYLTVIRQQHAGTITAANYFLNYFITGISLSVAVSIYQAIGIGVFFTILSGISITAIIPVCVSTITRITSYNKNYQPI
ncbi:unnamed protein product [Didymodactylos carnosus]|uniref:Major facilitator superfamily (MFS) profile domain-containing protein n=1 Tax=Didymodactylos carnosus TaxID=1234261 RepID=A0A815SIK9_9BILA|nr:unnamed protein product [Didymodactylos carnosus]CAF4355274.1 unnamed protein product [Didymodactylos carnosus]